MTKILVVDDTPDMVALMAKSVRLEGYDVATASNGPDALERVPSLQPDAILLDIMMPYMNGIEVLQHLKKNPETSEIPVILVSAKSEDTDVIEGLAAGAHDYITKPFKNAILAARLSSAVRIKKEHDKVVDINEQLQEEITKRKRKEQELVQAQKLEAIGQLAAGVAHEINTPSQYIGDNVRFLKDAFKDINQMLATFHETIDAAKNQSLKNEQINKIETMFEELDIEYLMEETPKAIDQSIEGIEKIAEIVRAMKEFSHPGSNEKQNVDLNKAIESTLMVSRSEWKYVSDVVTELDPQLPLVACYPSELNQAFLNMVINAAQAIGEKNHEDPEAKGTITIITSHSDDWVDIQIKDTGSGIPEGIQSKVFDHFFTTKEVGRGTGQGLTIAHSIIVEKHGGTINFESETGTGTTFTLRLPIGNNSTTQINFEKQNAKAACCLADN